MPVCIRPDIAHAVGVVSRFLSNLGREHWAAVLNGYLDTFVALPNYVFILGTESHCKKALQMQIWLEMLIRGNLHRGI